MESMVKLLSPIYTYERLGRSASAYEIKNQEILTEEYLVLIVDESLPTTKYLPFYKIDVYSDRRTFIVYQDVYEAQLQFENSYITEPRRFEWTVHNNIKFVGSHDTFFYSIDLEYLHKDNHRERDIYAYQGMKDLVYNIFGSSGNNHFNLINGNHDIDLSAGGNNIIKVHGNANKTNVIGGPENDIINGFASGGDFYTLFVDLSAGGNNIVGSSGQGMTVIAGPGHDQIGFNNWWDNMGNHPGNWAVGSIDLTLGGFNEVMIGGAAGAPQNTRAEITLGNGQDHITVLSYTSVDIIGGESSGITYIDLWGWGGTVHTGGPYGFTEVKVFEGSYDIELGARHNRLDLSAWTAGWAGAEISITFNSGKDTVIAHNFGMSFLLSGHKGDKILHLGNATDTVSFFALSGHNQVYSSDNVDIFQVDVSGGGTEAAQNEIFDFKFNRDLIVSENGTDIGATLLDPDSGFSMVRLGFSGYHVYEFYADRDVGGYQEGHVWLTIHSRDYIDFF